MIKEGFIIKKNSSNPWRCHGDVNNESFDKCGKIQLDFLKKEGLMPYHKMLEIGCGLFRGGVQFVSYLDECNYFALDSNLETIQKGYEEIKKRNLSKKVPKKNIIITSDFDSSVFNVMFDYIFLQSVWTHIDLSSCKLCLINSLEQIKLGSSLYTSVFMADESSKKENSTRKAIKNGPKKTYSKKDPYHYTESQIKNLAIYANADVAFIKWNFCESIEHKVKSKPEIKNNKQYFPYFIKFTKKSNNQNDEKNLKKNL